MGDSTEEGKPGSNGEWQVTDLNRLRRFLCFGEETGCLKVEPDQDKEKKKKSLAKENATCIMRLIESDKGTKVVEEIKKFSTEGRACKDKPMLFALAMCARLAKDLPTKQAAYKAIPEVCRIPTQLFQFIIYNEKLANDKTGWGSGLRKALTKWYNDKDPMTLAMHISKYIQRNGWSHVDILRLSHVKPKDDVTAAVLMFSTKGFEKCKENYGKDDASDEMKKVLKYLEAVHNLKHSKKEDEDKARVLIEEHRLVKEQVPTWLNESQEVWRALLPHMPLNALVKNLGKLSSLGLLDSSPSSCEGTVRDRLNDVEALKKARVHPFNILLALKTYETGKGKKGKKKWVPNGKIVDALTNAFYNTFQNISSTGKRFMLAVDVSKSMKYGGVTGSMQLNPATAAAAMALATARTEQNYQMLAFSKDVIELDINDQMTLQDVTRKISEIPDGSTDCSRPIQWALENKKAFDVFVVYTDCEPSGVKPADLLKKYRQDMKIPDAKLIVCALTSSAFTVADPNDCGMLDVAGFDVATPDIIRSFVLGEL